MPIEAWISYQQSAVLRRRKQLSMKRPPLSVNDNGIDFFSPAASCFCRAGSGVRASVQKHRHGSKWICMNTLYYAIRAPVDLDFPLVQFKGATSCQFTFITGFRQMEIWGTKTTSFFPMLISSIQDLSCYIRSQNFASNTIWLASGEVLRLIQYYTRAWT